MSKTGDRLRTLSGYWQPMGLGHTLMDIAKMADKEVDDALATKPIVGVDANPLKVGETVYGDDGKAWTIDGFDHGNEHSVVAHGEGGVRRQLRPEWLTHDAPVLAADGKPLEVGQTVWGDFAPGKPCRVVEAKSHNDVTVYCSKDNTKYYCDAKGLTHQRPVLDADGVPINEGDTVWTVRLGTERKVLGINRGVPDATHIVRCEDDSYYAPSQLTHNKPETDSWERIEEDAALSVDKYRERRGISKGAGMTWPQTVREDIVRRCRALAERGK